ncbi:hypothetical protein [Litoribrevibacter albus]|uniref:Avidin n=1 Tax=Litoribrevibacter albus TaxID=1473156 RepID=A0AA37S9R7_9GAMM|nr:hypothetical protein [Litoribrevibacter albus]GLQ30828.1 hypothetical protein GCM10007876_13070 [Litoribrevibacter albus]
MMYKNRIFYSFFLLLFLASVNPSALSAPLDGLHFIGETGMQGSTADQDGDDELSFTNGMFSSSGCVEWGFSPSVYTAEETADGIQFMSTSLSDDHGKIVWEGTVRGKNIETTFTWTKERWWWSDAHQVKWFKGKLKE